MLTIYLTHVSGMENDGISSGMDDYMLNTCDDGSSGTGEYCIKT